MSAQQATASGPASLPELTDELSRLVTQREIAQARADIRYLSEIADAPRVVVGGPASGACAMDINGNPITGRQLTEDFGDYVSPIGWINDDPTFQSGAQGYGTSNYAVPFSQIDDRADGKYAPIFRTEQDLALIRGSCRIITTGFISGANILENLTNYTIADGFTHEVRASKEATAAGNVPEGLVECAQHVLDTFFDDNEWKSDLESEIHRRSREDGETPLVLRPRPGSWRTVASIVEPDQITEPADSRDLESWLACKGAFSNEACGQSQDDCDGFVSSWSFGVHTRKADCSRPLGYHVVYDGVGNEWDYFPAGNAPLALRLGSGVMMMIKRNTPRNVKRGISDFYQAIKHMEQSEKLQHNTEKGGAIQAAIAFIREHAATATQTQIEALRSGAASGSVQRPAGNSGATRTVNRQRFDSGTVIDTNGTKYQYGPMGQSGAPNFIAVIQSALRYVGSRWQMPEYMISGDASNNNFASILIAGSPFVRSRQSDQRGYASWFHRIDWTVLRFAYEAGRFARFGLPWDQIEVLLDVIVTAPDITIGSKLEAAQVKNIERQAGVLSAKTWIKESGRDVDAEEENLAEERATGGSVPAPALDNPAGESAPAVGSAAPPAAIALEPKSPTAPAELPAASTATPADAGLNGAQITAASGLLAAIQLGTLAPEAAVVLLKAVGIPEADAQAMVAAQGKLPKPLVDTPAAATAAAAKTAMESADAGAARSKPWENYP